ncbi:NAD-dependent epimerase/dehydratase family protein [Propionivibrio limicola]|uniref:NAD-dependent epimerase/dehydratase family protein n=1 Tax=Propionivibrio limicola TaxID=167645 RepID=UPI001FE37D06|nr:NAD-dependent epimerase/dehydratase family protein [Propionivibrio limicola]
MRGKKVLITGGTGFTGRHLVRNLESAGCSVFCLGDHPADVPNFFLASILDREALSKVVREVQPDFVVHLAAISFVAHENVNDIYEINVIGSRNLLHVLAEEAPNVECVLLASSANVYGNSSVEAVNEAVPLLPVNDYAVSKLAMEYVARLWMGRLPIVIARPFNYTGVGQSANFLLPKIVDHFRRGAREIELGNLDVARDFSDVRMVTAAYCDLLKAAPAGEVFNVCSGVAYSLQDVLDMMAEIAGYRIRVTVNPAFVRSNEVKMLRGDNAKLVSAIGALKSRPLKETLAWMYSGEEI